jgi:hypothetical protein
LVPRQLSFPVFFHLLTFSKSFPNSYFALKLS